MEFSLSLIAENYLDKLNSFFNKHIFPNEHGYDEEIDNSDNPFHIPKLLNELKATAKKEELWNLLEASDRVT